METLFFPVTVAPVIHNASHCISGAKMITCICIVESNPPSELQFMLSNRILHNTDTKINTTITMGILQTEQGPHESIQCLAYNSMGRANITLSVTSSSSKCLGFLFPFHASRLIEERLTNAAICCFVFGQVEYHISISALP